MGLGPRSRPDLAHSRTWPCLCVIAPPSWWWGRPFAQAIPISVGPTRRRPQVAKARPPGEGAQAQPPRGCIGPCRVHPLLPGMGHIWVGPPPAHGRGSCLFSGMGPSRWFSVNERIRVGPDAPSSSSGPCSGHGRTAQEPGGPPGPPPGRVRDPQEAQREADPRGNQSPG